MEHEIPFGNSNRENGPTFLDFPLFLGIFQWDEPTKRVPFTWPRTWAYSYLFPSFLSFAIKVVCSARRILKSNWVNLIFAALSLIFITGHEGLSKFHADRVIIGLPCGQGQLSRIWKVQRDWLNVGRNVVLGWAGVGGEGRNTSSPKNACVGG